MAGNDARRGRTASPHSLDGRLDDAKDDLVVVRRHELEALIQQAVRRGLAEWSTPTEASEWVDTATAAELLGVHPRTVTKLARNEELPASRIGKLWRFRRSDIEAFLERT